MKGHIAAAFSFLAFLPAFQDYPILSMIGVVFMLFAILVFWTGVLEIRCDE